MDLCIGCASSIPASSSTKVPVTPCCKRLICQRCDAGNPRLKTYNPCLSCFGGVAVVNAAPEMNRTALKVGEVEADDVFVVGDDGDDDSEPGERGSDDLPGYAALDGPPIQAEAAIEESMVAPVVETNNTAAPAGYSKSEYWIKPRDSLMGISLKYGVDGRALCKLNNLPPSTLSTTPHLLHTRTTLTLPPNARRPASPPPPDAQERLEKRAKERAAKRLQFVTKEVDFRVAKAYVFLAGDDPMGTRTKESTKRSRSGGDLSGLEERAVDQYLDDEEWEAEQRREEVAKHNSKGDLWVIIDAKVFDLSKFANLHPGGLNVLLDEEVAGRDATQVFYSLHRQEVLQKPGYVRLQIGVVEGEKSAVAPPQPGALSQVPYAEPTWLSQGFHSPYFKESHKKLQKEMRKFVDEVICKQPHSVHPDGQAREADGKRVSQSVVDAMAAKNLHRMRLGPGKHLKGQVLFDGIVKPEEFDYFHEMIITQELARVGVRGYGDGLLAGMVIGLPPVLNFASEELKARIVPDIFAGKKFISLAISEAFAGSDVSGIKTTATLTEDGKHWIVTGTKKWITNGHFSDYFTVGCRTEGGFTVILVERGEGVETSPIKTSYSPAAGTAYITFDNVKVPVGNTLGPRDGGLIVMLANFNHERTSLSFSEAVDMAD
ncbi:hypothetical protein FRB98_009345 [Tulasnella sp. 332]|nr:hypothetical protein FRB98_009345 [Tulasnella sp. 332]